MISRVRARVALIAASSSLIALALAGAVPVIAAEPAAIADHREDIRKSTVEAAPSGRYVLVLREPPLSAYRGGRADLASPERAPGSGRLNARGAASVAYVEHLRERQRAFESRVGQLLGRMPRVSMRMQHAINALVVELSPDEAKRVASQPEVLLLSPEQLLELDTDVGPALIGAEPIWDGSNPGSGAPAEGEGRVIGVIDSGINFGSPSFAAVGPVDGYVQVNPLGDGNYLGTCAPGGPDEGRCNAKLIGGHDFVCGPPVNACTNAGLREEPGFGDTDSHGSHVASTAAGHRRDASFAGNTVRISGVAPHASIVAYDACYVVVSTGRGTCPSSATVSAVNQAVADGVVDVLNYSIGGGQQPWSDPTSLALLGAVNAGIFVAASAGNDGPGANTLGHLEPWVSSTAAAQHGRADFRLSLSVTGPTPVPPTVSGILLDAGTGGVNFNATIPDTTPLRISAGIDTAADGCSAYAANTFSDAIAVIRRGTCGFAIKVNNASAAGAIAVVIANNAAGTVAVNVPGTTVPVFGVSQAAGDALRDFGQANPSTATATIPYPPAPQPNTVDQLAAFSSRGPAGEFDLVKPDVTAPGARILAAMAGTTLTGSEELVGLMDGTSMASPHQAGAALLLRQLQPSWTVPELKSALQMTAFRGVTREDGSPATPFDMGAGRVRVNLAANAGLVLDETIAAFQAANPAIGGDASTLNLASLGERYCINQCQFVRRFRNTSASSVDWTAAVTGLSGTVSPASFNVAAGATIELTITIDSSAIPFDGLHRHGWLELRRVGGTPSDDLNLPISVSVPPPVLNLSPVAQSVTIAEGAPAAVDLSLSNLGGFPLSFDFDRSGFGALNVAATTSVGVASGFRATIYSDPATAGSQAQFAAEDLILGVPARIRSIQVDGFVVSGAQLGSAANQLTWSIYPDAGGLPAGNPQTNPAAALWTYTSTPAGAGVTTIGSTTIGLDLVAAGQNVNLPPGRYWIVVNTRSTFANRYAWYGSNQISGNSGFASLTVATNGSGNWNANPSFPGLTMRVRGDVECTAPWIGDTSPDSGSLLRGQTTQATVELGPTAAGSYLGAACVETNDPLAPRAASFIQLTVEPARLGFSAEPSATATVAQPFALQPSITVTDSNGALLTNYTLPVTLELASGAGPLSCDQNPVLPVNGVANFSGCRIDSVGTVTLRAVSGAASNSLTNPQIVVRPGPAARLSFAPAPSANAVAGVSFAVQPSVRIEDALGNLVDDATASVTLSISGSSGQLGCVANPVNAVAGIASFTGCSIDRAGLFVMDAATSGIGSATAQPNIDVAPAIPTELVFTSPPSASAEIGLPWPDQPAVTVRDAFGNVVVGGTEPVTLFLASGAGTLNCAANPVVPVAGVASFSGCRVDAVGAITLGASMAGIPNSSSNPAVTITRGPPSRLVFSTPPSANATAGAAFGVQPVLRVEDAFGNLVDDAISEVSLGVAAGTGPLACDSNPVSTVGGIATFSGCRIETAGTVALDASMPGIASATSQPAVTIEAGPPTRLEFTTAPPATSAVSTPWAVQPVVTVRDDFGNPVLGAVTPVTLSLASGAGTLSCAANPVTPSAGVASFSGCSVDAVGPVTLAASTLDIANSTSNPGVLITPGSPTRLVFVTAPSSGATAGAAFAVQPEVRVEDAFGNPVTDDPLLITLALASGGGALDCDANPVAAVAGVASFSGCRVNTAGTVTLNASAPGIAASTTQPQVAISVGAASRLVFASTPSATATAGQAFPAQPAVAVRDAFDNTVTDASTPVTLRLATGSGPLLCDSNPVTPVGGVASFSGCRVETAGTLSLDASAGAIGNATTAPQVVVVADAPSQLEFAPEPSPTATAGQPFAVQPQLRVLDMFGNLVTSATAPVTLALVSGAGTLQCSANTVTPVAGIAAFSGCRVDTAGTVTLNASSGAIAAATSVPQVTVAAGTASRLVFLAAPSGSSEAGQVWMQQPVVRIEDALGNPVRAATTPVTLAIVSGSGPLLCDANPVTPVDGVASFSGCRVDTAGTLRLDASTSDTGGATSQPTLTIEAAAPAQLEFSTPPSSTAAVNAPWAVQPAVTVRDAFGNRVLDATSPVSLSLASGAGVLSCAANPVQPVQGIASFSGCAIDTAGTVTLNASAAGIAGSTTQPQLVISVGTPTRLLFATLPSATATAGEAFAVQPAIAIQDGFGNIVTDATTPVMLQLASGSGPLLCDANPVTPIDGVARFSGCRVEAAGTITLAALASGLDGALALANVVIGAGPPDRLVFTTPPSPTASVGLAWARQPVVSVQDAYGNPISDFASPITLALASGRGPLVCSGNPVIPVGGAAQFTGCRIGSAGVVTLTASTAGIPSATTQPQVTAIPSLAVVVPAADRWALLLLMGLILGVVATRRAMP